MKEMNIFAPDVTVAISTTQCRTSEGQRFVRRPKIDTDWEEGTVQQEILREVANQISPNVSITTNGHIQHLRENDFDICKW